MEIVLRKYGNSTVAMLPPPVLKDVVLAAGQTMTLDTTDDGRISLLRKRKCLVTDLIAECDREVAAVGGFNASRMIILNYVSPNHRFAGVSKALLAAMEEALGPGEATLDSTVTARPFYLAAGWLEVGPPKAYRMVDGYPMRKMLS